MKFTRTAYTGLGLKPVLDELVNLCRLEELPSDNPDLHARRHGEEHPDKVRITISVERVKERRKRKRARPSVPARAAGGLATAAAMSATQRSERSRKGAIARWGKAA